MAEDTLQKSTEQRLVPTAYYEMLYLRFMGLTYEQIAERTGYKPQTVRAYFARGGVLNELYAQWVATAKKNSMEEALDMMFGHLPDIIRSRIVAAKGYGASANTAAEMILRYTLGNAEKSIIQNNMQIQVINFKS